MNKRRARAQSEDIFGDNILWRIIFLSEFSLLSSDCKVLANYKRLAQAQVLAGLIRALAVDFEGQERLMRAIAYQNLDVVALLGDLLLVERFVRLLPNFDRLSDLKVSENFAGLCFVRPSLLLPKAILISERRLELLRAFVEDASIHQVNKARARLSIPDNLLRLFLVAKRPPELVFVELLARFDSAGLLDLLDLSKNLFVFDLSQS